MSHVARPRLAARHPVHVTLKLRREAGNLRTKTKAKVIRRSILRVLNGGFRVIDWSIQRDHLHAIVEASGTERLSRGVQGLSIRIARGLNRVLGRRGKVFADRFHARILRTPRQVRNAKAYVLLNHRRHVAQGGAILPSDAVDPHSSWAWSDGWRNLSRQRVQSARAGPEAERCVAEPRSWLLQVGWRRHGLIRVDEIPSTPI